MPDYLVLPLALVAYILIMKFVLPRLGVPT
jgi:hypothetical protein